ncbi:protein of unknown function [Ruminococcaceae bacterium BL-6]|nr:protein of unknown function [Ruminococcaceae bacterium BL-6]
MTVATAETMLAGSEMASDNATDSGPFNVIIASTCAKTMRATARKKTIVQITQRQSKIFSVFFILIIPP